MSLTTDYKMCITNTNTTQQNVSDKTLLQHFNLQLMYNYVILNFLKILHQKKKTTNIIS